MKWFSDVWMSSRGITTGGEASALHTGLQQEAELAPSAHCLFIIFILNLAMRARREEFAS